MPSSNFSERMKELEFKHLLVIFLAFILFFGVLYGIYNYRQGQIGPAEIMITSPEDLSVPYEKEVLVIEGETKSKTLVRVGDLETESDKDGSFRAEVPLSVGENIILIEVGEGANYNSATLIVYRDPKPEKITEKDVEEILVSERLNDTGPETLWLPEIVFISGSLLLYLSMRKRFKKALKKNVLN